ncbi:MAG: hypothetical protein H6713_38520 [Myxococcales bacterium]|nr:hypothetical protein [Myxococcales bacterium]
MNDPELEGLWDPSAGAGGYTRALERRLRPLRRDEPPPLVLPERATRTPSRVWTYAAVAFAAAVALVWVARRGPEEPAP